MDFKFTGRYYLEMQEIAISINISKLNLEKPHPDNQKNGVMG